MDNSEAQLMISGLVLIPGLTIMVIGIAYYFIRRYL